MKTTRKLGALAAAVITLGSLTTGANGAVITLDEFSPEQNNGTTSSPRYSILGVTFSPTVNHPTWNKTNAETSKNWWLKSMTERILSGFNKNSDTKALSFDFLLSDFLAESESDSAKRAEQ